MLNFALKGTYKDETGYSWDYYRDDQLDPNPNPNTFYIIPKPQFVVDNAGNPAYHMLTYRTDGSDNGSGSCRFDVELSVPPKIEAAIASAIKANPIKFPNVSEPVFTSLALNRGSSVSFDFLCAGVTTSISTTASDFGSNVATFLIDLTKEQLDTLKGDFSNSGGSIDIKYYLSVPARLQGVSALLNFDSSIAYQYQVTQPSYNSWGDQTSPGSVEKMLKESAASKVTLTWGIANPPAELIQSVTDWANSTLANMVSAEVQKVIELQSTKSDKSFSINEVSNFNFSFVDNVVVDWLIEPTASLPTFTDMGLNIDNFVGIVNEQQQQMTVVTNLPFSSDSQDQIATVPAVLIEGLSKPAFVKSVTVTLQYPTLSEANATYTFTSNGSKTFVADYSPAAGPAWSLEYAVDYEDPNMATVNGKVENITSGSLDLKVEEAGILTVVFDASQAFTSEGTNPVELDVNFSYVNADEPLSKSIRQVVKILASDSLKKTTISSLQSMPVSTTYNYQVSYIFPGTVKFDAPLVQNQNGFLQILPAVNAVHTCNLIVFVSPADAATDPVFDATVNMWYETAPALPPGYSSNQPTKASPAVFNITPDVSPSGGLFKRALFTGLLSGDQPLMYSASINCASGQIDINSQQIQNSQPSIMVTPKQRYYTLEIDPSAIDWDKADFSSVQVLITQTVAQGTAPDNNGTGVNQQQIFTWNKGEMGNKFQTLSIQHGNTVSYDCKVNYIAGNSKVQTIAFNNLTDVVFNIPASAAVQQKQEPALQEQQK
jgi:hypothetical protein